MKFEISSSEGRCALRSAQSDPETTLTARRCFTGAPLRDTRAFCCISRFALSWPPAHRPLAGPAPVSVHFGLTTRGRNWIASSGKIDQSTLKILLPKTDFMNTWKWVDKLVTSVSGFCTKWEFQLPACWRFQKKEREPFPTSQGSPDNVFKRHTKGKTTKEVEPVVLQEVSPCI